MLVLRVRFELVPYMADPAMAELLGQGVDTWNAERPEGWVTSPTLICSIKICAAPTSA